MRLFASFCLLMIHSFVCAESTVPEGCHAVAVQNESLSVHVKKTKNTLIFIHNITAADLWITHSATGDDSNSTSSNWSSRLQTDNWAALVVNKESYALHCIESRPGHEQHISCEGAIAVCQWKDAKMPLDSSGDFLAEEDMTSPALIAALGGRGFVLNNKVE